MPDVLKIANDLTALFDKIQHGGPLTAEIGVYPQRYVAAYGLAAHAKELAVDACDLIQRGRFESAVPLTRLIFECAMHCQWLVMNPSAHSALLTADETHRRNLNKTLKASDSFKHLYISEQASDAHPAPVVSKASIQTICKALNGGDESLYVIYRTLSGGGHSGVPLIERWIETAVDPVGVTLRINPAVQPHEFNQLAATVAISLLWTNAAFNCMTRSQPIQPAINSISQVLETKPLLGAGKLILDA